MRFILSFILCLWMTIGYAEQDLYSFTSAQNAQRFNNLTKEIRCVVCQNQNIADSNAPLANDLRAKVYLMIQQQKSDAEIKSYLVARYGEFILLKPLIKQRTFLLWAFPLIGLLSMLIIFARVKKSGAYQNPN